VAQSFIEDRGVIGGLREQRHRRMEFHVVGVAENLLNAATLQTPDACPALATVANSGLPSGDRAL
jgi:hypothetical protein